MSLIEWTRREMVGGEVFSIENSEYAIRQTDGKFFVMCSADRDDIGPLDDFKQAEDIVLKINVCMGQYEEGLWKYMAAQAIKANTAAKNCERCDHSEGHPGQACADCMGSNGAPA